MELLILGNGFDLQCGIESSYNDFFNYRYGRCSNSRTKAYSDINNYFEIYNSFKGTIKVNDKVERICQSAEGINKDISSGVLSLWDLLFISFQRLDENTLQYEWNDIESRIESIVADNNNISNKTNLQSISDLTAHVLFDISRSQLDMSSSYTQSIFSLDVKLISFIIQKSINTIETMEEFLEFLLVELKKFENFFKEYLLSFFGKQELKKKYNNNAVSLISQIIDRNDNGSTYKYNILNFNYTIFDRIFDDCRIDQIFWNTHGSIRGGEIIFGIDYTELDNNIESLSSEYIFSKTARKLFLDESPKEDETDIFKGFLNDPDDVGLFTLEKKYTKIKFYGHSLSKADFSYFQSIFDAHEIYSSNVEITFYYSNYVGCNIIENKKTQIYRIFNLLQKYGKTLANKDHGKNLIHKLLLEKRITIKTIPGIDEEEKCYNLSLT